MLAAGAVDVLQADTTRCGGATGFLRADALCDAHGAALSAHCAPQLHAHLACACMRTVHIEYLHDHARIEQLLFDGA
jgi:L-alanine-DL-glutamate epimerase-like enolase superfamily enzyme